MTHVNKTTLSALGLLSSIVGVAQLLPLAAAAQPKTADERADRSFYRLDVRGIHAPNCARRLPALAMSP